MAKPTEAARRKLWNDRLASGQRIYNAWDTRYKPGTLLEYYLKRQHQGEAESDAQKKYTINYVFPTIETQLPSLLFYKPTVKVEPRQAHADDVNSQAGDRAQLIESTLQTFIDDPKVHFGAHTGLALKDAFFRYGVVEVGYSGDWIDNPNAGKPLTKDGSDEPQLDGDGEPVLAPAKLPKPGSERPYLKRIPPQTVRVSANQRNITEENDWIGYYEWHHLEDVKRNPRYKNTAKLRAGGSLSTVAVDDDTKDGDDGGPTDRAGMLKVWKIWDLRRRVKHVFADGTDTFLIEGEEAQHLPLAVLKFVEIPDQWYPMPPVFNWIDPQDEINEIRESRRTHRRRFVRRYTVHTGGLDIAEMDKLMESTEDGTYAVRKTQEDPILPVQDAPLDPSNTTIALNESKDDFSRIAGVSDAQRGVADAGTATEANIINIHSQLRESRQRVLVANWLSDICRLMLLAIKENMQLEFAVKLQADPYAADVAGAQRAAEQWQSITAEDLGDIDVDVKVELSSLSPVTEDAQRASWSQVLALLTNTGLLMILMQSEPLLRKTLGFYGIKSEQEVREIQRVGQAVLQMQVLMQAQAGGPGGPSVPSLPGMPGAASGLPAQVPGGVQ